MRRSQQTDLAASPFLVAKSVDGLIDQDWVAKVQREGVDADALARTKSNLKYGMAMSLDTPDAIAGSLSHYIQLTGDPESINRLYGLYDQVSQDDVKAMANRYFQPERLTIATISDDETAALQ